MNVLLACTEVFNLTILCKVPSQAVGQRRSVVSSRGTQTVHVVAFAQLLLGVWGV